MSVDTSGHFIKTRTELGTHQVGKIMGRDLRTSDAEIWGLLLRALSDSMGVMKLEARRLLSAHGIADVDPERWYPIQSVIRALEDVHEQVGPRTVRAIGQRIATYAIVPAPVDTFVRFIAELDSIYRLNHRGARDIGGYHLLGSTPASARLRCDNPYPCEFDQGLFAGFYERFTPRGPFRLRVVHEPGGCRDQGGESCLYQLTW